ncbi:MAG TPA: hypothetical protein VK709_19055 [Candidatus Saccharimonadales bacterium]|jgi:hypothetical protein|nr:hypothetical protein [Candidatus Saccharimonadales bacterium]
MQPTERMLKFAQTYNLKLVDTGTEKIAAGKFGEIADVDDPDGSLRLRILPASRAAKVDKALRIRFRLAEAGGLRLKTKSDAESIWYFDPSNETESRLVFKISGVRSRARRVLSPERREQMAAVLAAARLKRQSAITPAV